MTVNVRHHAVLLSGHRIGTLRQRDDAVRFEFSPEYWDDPDRRVLGQSFENDPSALPHGSRRLDAWFANLLPEGTLRRWIADDRDVSEARDLELLLRVGHDLPGAVEVLENGAPPSESDFQVESSSAGPDLSASMSPWKFSLAGVQMKFSMLQRHDRLTIPLGGDVGDWIVKLPDAKFPQVPLNEYVMMQLAAQVGVSVPEVNLLSRSELPPLPDGVWRNGEDRAYAIRRFDRDSQRGRVHIEDFAQVRGIYPERKYTGTFETVFAIAYRAGDVESLREAARRLAFMVIIGNGDGHLKNWSLIYPDGRTPRLSPAYDLVSTAPYVSDGLVEDLGLKFGGSKDFDRISWRHFDRIERRLGAAGGDLPGVVADVVERFESSWAALSSGLADVPAVETWISRHYASRRLQLLGGR